MSITYAPSASAALFDAYAGRAFDDPLAYTAAHNKRVDAKYFLKPIQDEMLNLIALALSGGAALKVRNETGATLGKGALLYIAGYNASEGRFLVNKSDPADQAKPALAALDAALNHNSNGVAYAFRDVSGLDTSAAGAVGDKVYASATPGNFAFAAPSNSAQWVVGIVTAKDAVNGAIRFMPGRFRQEQLAALNSAQIWTGIQTFNPSATRGKVMVQHGGAMRLQFGVVDAATTYGAGWGPGTPADNNWWVAVNDQDLALNAPGTSGAIGFQWVNSAVGYFNDKGLTVGQTKLATGANVLMFNNGSAWTPAADQCAQWAADYAAGDARTYFRSEAGNGPIILGNDGIEIQSGANATSTHRTCIDLRNNGYADPGASGAGSNGDKFIFWDNRVNAKYAIGMGASGDYWFQAYHPSLALSYQWYLGPAGIAATTLMMQMGGDEGLLTLGGWTRALSGNVTDACQSALRLDPRFSGAHTVTRHNYLDLKNPALSSTSLTDACVARFDAAAGAHKAVDSGTTKTTPGTVDAWLKFNVNGTLYYVPAYTSKTA